MEEKTLNQDSAQEVFFDLSNGEFIKIDMNLPLQMLFDDVMTFVSQTEI